MGCDIHFYVEKRAPGGAWTADFVLLDEAEGGDPLYGERFYRRREYSVFAVLAGVRNYEGCKPIAKPRGVPSDASPEFRALVLAWGVDGHSHSWLTVEEIAAYDWSEVPWADTFRQDTLPALLELGPPSDVRCVFFFDN